MQPSGERIEPAVERGDSVLGRWTAAHWRPGPDHVLAAILDRIWYFDGTLALARERVFPDGLVEIVVQLDEPHRDGDLPVPAAYPAVCVNGVRTGPNVVVAPAGRCRVVGLRLRAAHARTIVGVPPRDLGIGTFDLADVAGDAAHDLGERCFAAAESRTSQTERAIAVVRAAARWALGRLRTAPQASAVTFVADAIVRRRGAASIESLRARTGLSRPELAKRFRDELGITPKRFARIVRFHSALRAIDAGATPGDAALQLDYFDQAHLHRDFEEFARMTPGQFLGSTRYGGSASIAEP